jgi:hypothetical protein
MAKDFTQKMYNVHSGNIAKIGWQEFENEHNPTGPKIGVLQVEFNRGDTYQYHPVPKKLFGEFWTAESRGSWFDTNIKKNTLISYEKITPKEND